MLSKEALSVEVDAGRVNLFSHKDDDNLVGYNYTDECQYSRLWNDTNIMCRGLVFYKDMCIARPFSKFFNIEEIKEDLSQKKVSFIHNKEDGSLIISFLYNDSVNFCTRGSFHSEQAIIAEKIWNEKYSQKIDSTFFSKWTFLFELVGPSNVNVTRGYLEDDLILLSLISLETGLEAPESFVDELSIKIGCKRPEKFYSDSVEEIFEQIKENKDPNFEGVVITFDDGMKVKIKSYLYVKIHKILSSMLSKRTILDLWVEFHKTGRLKSINDFSIPDEIYLEIETSIKNISDDYAFLKSEVEEIYEKMKQDALLGMSRKDMALKWKDSRWLLNSIFSNINNIDDICVSMFKKRYMDGYYD